MQRHALRNAWCLLLPLLLAVGCLGPGFLPATPLPAATATRMPRATATRPPATVTPRPAATAAAPQRPERGEEAEVLRVVDGDTIIVLLDGQVQRVRYIGINAPESVKPDSPVEYMGPESSKANQALVGARHIWLERDISPSDKYGRLLRYVWVGDIMVNGELVRQGYAQAVTYPPDVKYQAWLHQLESDARAAERGLWAEH